jgi:hypothetical protein
MGYMTLEEMTVELSLNLGGKAPAPDRLKLWVNFGLLNLASYILFDEFRVSTSIAILDGVTSYSYPEDMLGVVTLEIDGKRLLKARRLPSYEDLDPSQPTFYLKRGDSLVLWPEPDTAYTLDLEYIKTPARLVAPGDKSPLPANWDNGIIMLATHHGFLSLGDNDVADRWLGRFLGYASSRKKEEDISADVPHGGLEVAWEWADVNADPARISDE